jgi:hypothetical protein
MKFQEFSHDKLQVLPKIEKSDLRFLWYSRFYDGPRSGLLVYENRKYWFEHLDDLNYIISGQLIWIFLVVELTPTQLSEEEYWHDLFREKVGTHTDYDENGRRRPHILHPKEMWHEFYDAAKNRSPFDISNNEIIGWFEY